VSGLLLVLAGFAIVAALIGWSRWLAGRRAAAAGHVLLSAAAATTVALAWPVERHLATYERLVPGQEIAEVFVEQAGARRYRVTLTRLPSGRMQVLELGGTQWRLELRALQWTGRAAQLGLAPRQRIERIAARDAAEPPGRVQTFELGRPAGSDLWDQVRSGTRGAGFAEALLLEGPWMALGDGQRYVLRVARAPLALEARRRSGGNEAAAP
jgi:hypothetical protein